ncbi:hypothetical protein BCR33DRAFT_852616 [Rhizoclosmatium globosum]|uniref:Integral membrane protein n=1 Tax=Rhizoclosmatium globosum TaxID=329046 RepID=A0A1Y2C131_9FUNG|nr:hypothetical protein BCR33DRAFT_852616 [Rhizoclosmatium globosum]|eukprot:ORY40729.1 hypothetical protein BCR33DRAFT_852616 [Rhizoclosmatium globosum]
MIANMTEQIYHASWLLPATIAVVNPLGIAGILWFLIVFEPKRRPHSNVLSSSNLAILGIWIFGTTYYGSSAYFNHSRETSSVAFAVAYLSLGCGEWCYLWFSFKRSEELLRKRWSRRVLSVLRMQLNLFPIAIIAPPLKLVIPGSVSNSVKTIIFISLFSLQCMIVCTMDGIMAMTFVLHIRNMKQDSTLVSPKLTVIANYGLTACVFVFLIVGCLGTCLVCRLIDPDMEDETMFNLYRVFWMLKDVFIEFIGFAVVAMRIALAFVSNEPDSAHIQTRIRESLVAFKSTLGSRDSEMREALSTESGDGFQGRKSSTNSPNTYNIEKRVSFTQAAIFAGENKTLTLVTSTLK